MSTPVKIELKTSTTPEQGRVGQVLQAMVKEAGFDLSLRPTEYATMLSETDAGDYDVFTSGWSGRSSTRTATSPTSSRPRAP